MGASTYVLNETDKTAFEFGERWSHALKAEDLVSKNSIIKFLDVHIPERSKEAKEELANRVISFIKSNPYKVHLGPCVPDDYLYVDGFISGDFWCYREV